MTVAYDPARTAFVLVDPYNDFFADDGKIYPRLREVAEAVGLRQHIRELLAAARAAGIPVVIAPHRRWHPGDVEGWLRSGRPHRLRAAVELNAPIYAEHVLTTADVIAALKD